MAGLREIEKQFFPLQKIQDVIDLFKNELKDNEPNLTLMSIVLGVIENILTVNRAVSSDADKSNTLEPIFPVIELSTIEALYTKFVTHIKRSVDKTKFPDKFATRELVKIVSDVVWCCLSKSFKDRAHLQSLYSFLTGNKLDCFGVAFAVVAAFQILEYNDVHLSLSEDHAWVVFGEDLKETAEVTWHGKGNEDKRGQPITASVVEKSWLYLNGQPVICNRHMEVAAIVSGINPSINLTVDSVEMGSLQQELLWLLYDLGHLSKYPMALGNLGDLEEISPTPGRPPPVDIFEESIQSSKVHYHNQHVYPYTYLGGYHYRNHNYKKALKAWAEATNAVKNFNYNREDEEIYKEFLEVGNDLIPTMMKHVASENASRIHQTSISYDPDCYADFLRFYDGICEWEEDSKTPVLHITWAKQLVNSLAKFDPTVRKLIHLISEDGEESSSSSESDEESEEEREIIQDENRNQKKKVKAKKGKTHDKDKSDKINGQAEDSQIKSMSDIEAMVSKVDDDLHTEPNPNIEALAQACGDSILNPEYLLGNGEPFTAVSTTSVVTASSDTRVDLQEFLSTKSNGSPFMGMSVDAMLKAESPSDMMMYKKEQQFTNGVITPVSPNSPIPVSSHESPIPEPEPEPMEEKVIFEPVTLCLKSHKMLALRKIFSSEKCNYSAIQLQLTAQSQVHFKNHKRSTEGDLAMARKRQRRE
ncbi:menin-like [Mytilus edulis]|uniref:menin-like n=1 Tax=Mytilus edulis TaxID=6550 RepID=UPI0039EF36BE